MHGITISTRFNQSLTQPPDRPANQSIYQLNNNKKRGSRKQRARAAAHDDPNRATINRTHTSSSCSRLSNPAVKLSPYEDASVDKSSSLSPSSPDDPCSCSAGS